MIFTSPHARLSIPTDRSIWDELAHCAQTTPTAPFLVCGVTDRALSFSEAFDQARHVAAGLYHDGVRKGDVVLVLSVNCIEYPIVLLALYRLEAICSPSPTRRSAQAIAEQIDAAGASTLIAHASLLEKGRAAAAAASAPVRRVYAINQRDPHDMAPTIQDFIDVPRPCPMIARIDPLAVVALPFSRGTTATPKAIQLTAHALYATARQTALIEPRISHLLALLPFNHIISTIVLHVAILHRAAVVVLSQFELPSALRAIATYKIQKLTLVPPLVQFLAHHPLVDKYDLSSVRYICSVGARLDQADAQRASERLGAVVLQGYGLTECCGGVTMSEQTHHRAGSVGRLLPNVEMRVISLVNDEDLGANQRGELLVRSPQTTIGYLNDPDATREVFTSDGFLRTGDIGYVDDDGFVYFVDRVHALIEHNGLRATPVEIERVLNHHPLIADSCCVRGHLKDTGEEVVKAFVVLKQSVIRDAISDDDVIMFVASKVAPFKRVRQVEFVDAIPKSPTGRVLRRQLQMREHASRYEELPSRM